MVEPVPLLGQQLDGYALSLLYDVFAVPHSNEDGTEALQDDGLVVLNFEQLGREAVMAC